MYARKFDGRHLLDDHRWIHTCEPLVVCELWGKWDKCSIILSQTNLHRSVHI